jgi:ubiquinone/menaquinone biosynthesis C-methylase UbiE
MSNHQRSVRRVRWPVPIESSFNPYMNSVPAVRWLFYARMEAALSLVRSDVHARVLDVGCWAGYFLPSLLCRFSEVWGVDDDSGSVVSQAEGHWTILQIAGDLCEAEAEKTRHLGLVKATALKLPFAAEYFDVIFCLDTLAHISPAERGSLVDELRRVTKRDGQLIFSLPIEIGMMHHLKKVLRVMTRKNIDAMTTTYDFRQDLHLLESSFTECRHDFFPLRTLGTLNPVVLVSCQ